MLLRCILALCLVISTSCATSRERALDEVHRQTDPTPVRMEPLPEGGLRLSFDPTAPNPNLEMLRVEEAWAVLAAIHEFRPPMEKPRLRLTLVSSEMGDSETSGPKEWERRLREEFLSRFDPPRLPLPESLENSRLVLALQLSPRYMGAGVRETAQEMFRSPLFVASLALSVLVYFTAWLAPEPLFTKAFAAALTVRLAMLVGVLELTHVARACLQLYRDAESARTVEELEAVAERFGKALGGSALRVMMLVAGAGLGKALPKVPEGGLWALLTPPRYAAEGGLMVSGTTTTAHVMADGTLIVTGVATGTAISSASRFSGGACADGSQKKEGYEWHHLATNKNDTSSARGGPWTPLFEQLFAKAGMSLDDPANRIYLKGHRGPHPEEYHAEVHDRLQSALSDCKSVAHCGSKLREALVELADKLCTPNSYLNRLLTKP